MASRDGNIMEMCRLIDQGAEIDYVHSEIDGEEERSGTPLI